jgi:hypothetical protein
MNGCGAYFMNGSEFEIVEQLHDMQDSKCDEGDHELHTTQDIIQ